MPLSRVHARGLIVLSLYGLALSMTASMLDPPLYTAKVNQLVVGDAWRNTVLGVITFAGLVLAAVVQPIWGALSDRSTTRWGRRIPFLVGGSLANAVLFVLLAFAGNVWLLAILVLSIQLASNAIQGAYQGLIPDQVPSTQRGVAAGVKTLTEMLAVIVGPLTAGLLLGISGWSVPLKALATVSVLHIVYTGVTLVTLWHARRRPLQEAAFVLPEAARPGPQNLVRHTFRIDWRVNRDLRWWLLNRFLFWCALLTLRTFLINYIEQVIGLSAAEAQRITGLLGALLGGLIFLIILPAGYIADRVGRRPLLIAAGLVAAVGASIFLAARSIPVMFGAGLFIGLGGGLFVTSSWALATDLVPQEEAARYLGITNLATAGGSAAARLTGPLIDTINQLSRSSTLGYVGVYALGALLFLLSSWAIRNISGD